MPALNAWPWEQRGASSGAHTGQERDGSRAAKRSKVEGREAGGGTGSKRLLAMIGAHARNLSCPVELLQPDDRRHAMALTNLGTDVLYPQVCPARCSASLARLSIRVRLRASRLESRRCASHPGPFRP
jgi:hypothetical protein